MTDFLKQIIQTKQTEINRLKQYLSQHDKQSIKKLATEARAGIPLLEQCLKKPQLTVIAEIKRHSPSEGFLAPISDPGELAKQYILGGASAISVLTDKTYFYAQESDLPLVRASVDKKIPVMRKDFIIDPLQIIESALLGADVILLIARVLKDRLQEMIQKTKLVGLECMVEVHTESELDLAVESGSHIIGINCRDLKTFSISLNQAFSLVEKIPHGIYAVAESGISHPSQARLFHQAGFSGVLIGKALVTSNDPVRFIQSCIGEAVNEK